MIRVKRVQFDCRRPTVKKRLTLESPIPRSRIGTGEVWDTTTNIPECLVKKIQQEEKKPWVVPTNPKEQITMTAGAKTQAKI